VAIGLIGAFGAALCYGVGSVLQALAARQTATAEGLDPRLLLRLLKSWRYLLGLGLDGLGFLLSLAAVRTLPLFAVQSVIASSLAVTAVLGAIFLHMRLSRLDVIGLVVVVFGLILVGCSAAEDHTIDVSSAEEWGVLIASIALGLLAIPAGRLSGATSAAALGGIAGLAFGATAVAARMLPGDLSVDNIVHELGTLLSNPTTYALAVACVVAMLTYSTALQRGTVTQATAPMVVGETIAPALVGILLLGDRPREGWDWVAVIGFSLAVGGALSLARHGEISEEK
jgi:drug/metabolite transporter (DMT)-like permease